MISLTVAMIVKNETDTLARCLDCAKEFADELIIVDTGSTDNTKEIAFKYTDKVLDFKWVEDFSKARNFSFSHATKEYIMWLDADDVILEEDIAKIKELKKNLNNNIDMVMFKYNLNLDENDIPKLTYYRERIIKNCKNAIWVSPVHEVIPSFGNILYTDICITHKKIHISPSDRNLKIFEKMKKDNIPFDARQSFYYARELMYNQRYDEAINEFISFLNRKDGFKENKISACLDLSNIYFTLKDNANAINYLLHSMQYGLPRAEACVKLAWLFILDKKYDIAIYWLKQALNDKLDISSGGFYVKDYYDFIPYINLGYCYFYLGDIKKAIYYNELAGKIKNTDETYLKNSEIYNNAINNTKNN